MEVLNEYKGSNVTRDLFFCLTKVIYPRGINNKHKGVSPSIKGLPTRVKSRLALLQECSTISAGTPSISSIIGC